MTFTRTSRVSRIAFTPSEGKGLAAGPQASTLSRTWHLDVGEEAVGTSRASVIAMTTNLLPSLCMSLVKASHLLSSEGIFEEGHIVDPAFEEGRVSHAMNDIFPRVDVVGSWLRGGHRVVRRAAHTQDHAHVVGTVHPVDGLCNSIWLTIR